MTHIQPRHTDSPELYQFTLAAEYARSGGGFHSPHRIPSIGDLIDSEKLAQQLQSVGVGEKLSKSIVEMLATSQSPKPEQIDQLISTLDKKFRAFEQVVIEHDSFEGAIFSPIEFILALPYINDNAEPEIAKRSNAIAISLSLEICLISEISYTAEEIPQLVQAVILVHMIDQLFEHSASVYQPLATILGDNLKFVSINLTYEYTQDELECFYETLLSHVKTAETKSVLRLLHTEAGTIQSLHDFIHTAIINNVEDYVDPLASFLDRKIEVNDFISQAIEQVKSEGKISRMRQQLLKVITPSNTSDAQELWGSPIQGMVRHFQKMEGSVLLELGSDAFRGKLIDPEGLVSLSDLTQLEDPLQRPNTLNFVRNLISGLVESKSVSTIVFDTQLFTMDFFKLLYSQSNSCDANFNFTDIDTQKWFQDEINFFLKENNFCNFHTFLSYNNLLNVEHVTRKVALAFDTLDLLKSLGSRAVFISLSSDHSTGPQIIKEILNRKEKALLLNHSYSPALYRDDFDFIEATIRHSTWSENDQLSKLGQFKFPYDLIASVQNELAFSHGFDLTRTVGTLVEGEVKSTLLSVGQESGSWPPGLSDMIPSMRLPNFICTTTKGQNEQLEQTSFNEEDIGDDLPNDPSEATEQEWERLSGTPNVS